MSRLNAAQQIVLAYEKADTDSSYIDWSDLDDAYEQALTEIDPTWLARIKRDIARERDL